MDNDEKWLGGWNDKTQFSIDTGQYPWEIFTAAKIVKKHKPKKIVEIGCLEGGTLAIWLTCLTKDPHSVVIGIDPDMNRIHDSVRMDRRVHLITSTSNAKDTIDLIRDLSPIDVLFVDGNHAYEYVKFDFSVYGAFVRKGGLILLHDIATYGRNDVGVPTLWKEIRELGLYKMEEIIGKHEAIIDAGGIGVVYK